MKTTPDGNPSGPDTKAVAFFNAPLRKDSEFYYSPMGTPCCRLEFNKRTEGPLSGNPYVLQVMLFGDSAALGKGLKAGGLIATICRFHANWWTTKDGKLRITLNYFAYRFGAQGTPEYDLIVKIIEELLKTTSTGGGSPIPEVLSQETKVDYNTIEAFIGRQSTGSSAGSDGEPLRANGGTVPARGVLI